VVASVGTKDVDVHVVMFVRSIGVLLRIFQIVKSDQCLRIHKR
jgi:hypothetical protein